MVVEQHRRLEVAVALADDEGDVELAVADLGVEGEVVLGLEEADVEAGELGPQLLDDRRQQHVGHALERADVDPPGLAGPEPLDGVPGGVDAGEDVPGVAEHDLAERGQLDRSGAAGAVEELVADEPLQRRDLLADGGLGVAEAHRRLGERPLGGDGVEGDEVAELEITEAGHNISVAVAGHEGSSLFVNLHRP